MGRRVRIVDLPPDHLGRVLSLLPPKLGLLTVCKQFHVAAVCYCPSWWEEAVVRCPSNSGLDHKRAIRGFQRTASQCKTLVIEDGRLGALIVPMLEVAGRECSQLEVLRVRAGSAVQFKAAVQASCLAAASRGPGLALRRAAACVVPWLQARSSASLSAPA
jgi:hypothetical protein